MTIDVFSIVLLYLFFIYISYLFFCFHKVVIRIYSPLKDFFIVSVCKITNFSIDISIKYMWTCVQVHDSFKTGNY